MLEIQNLTKQCNETLILATLSDGPKHGYQLVLSLEQKSDGYFSFKHGTLYPILHKLEKEGLIKGTWDEDSPRRKRKSYQLTRNGSKRLAEQVANWKQFCRNLTTITEGKKA
mgnify:FL=1